MSNDEAMVIILDLAKKQITDGDRTQEEHARCIEAINKLESTPYVKWLKYESGTYKG